MFTIDKAGSGKMFCTLRIPNRKKTLPNLELAHLNSQPEKRYILKLTFTASEKTKKKLNETTNSTKESFPQNTFIQTSSATVFLLCSRAICSFISSDFPLRTSSSCSSLLIARASCNWSSSSPADTGRAFSISDVVPPLPLPGEAVCQRKEKKSSFLFHNCKVFF